jgi:hypothetical protein
VLAAVATDRPRPLVRLLDTRPLRSLGSFSYSLYLTHAPIVIAVSYGIVAGRVPPGVPSFFVLAAILVPLTVIFARLFAAVFEIPFQRHRGWNALRAAATDSWNRNIRPRGDRVVRSRTSRLPQALLSLGTFSQPVGRHVPFRGRCQSYRHSPRGTNGRLGEPSVTNPTVRCRSSSRSRAKTNRRLTRRQATTRYATVTGLPASALCVAEIPPIRCATNTAD